MMDLVSFVIKHWNGWFVLPPIMVVEALVIRVLRFGFHKKISYPMRKAILVLFGLESVGLAVLVIRESRHGITQALKGLGDRMPWQLMLAIVLVSVFIFMWKPVFRMELEFSQAGLVAIVIFWVTVDMTSRGLPWISTYLLVVSVCIQLWLNFTKLALLPRRRRHRHRSNNTQKSLCTK